MRLISLIFSIAAVLTTLTPITSDATARPQYFGTHSSAQHQWPISPATITRGFDRLEHNWHRGHRGVDLAAEPGSLISSSASGSVYFAGRINHQLSVSILHPSGIRTTYGPLESTHLKKGDRIRKGEPIGVLSPPTTQHPEPGLHWGALRGSVYLNPVDLITPRQIVLKPVSLRALSSAG